MIKNMPMAEVVDLKTLVDYQEGQIVSRTLTQKNSRGNMTLFAFAAGEELSTHAASGDAFVYVLEGETLITIDNQEMRLGPGQAVVMPAHVPHAVAAPSAFKMLLVVVRADTAEAE